MFYFIIKEFTSAIFFLCTANLRRTSCAVNTVCDRNSPLQQSLPDPIHWLIPFSHRPEPQLNVICRSTQCRYNLMVHLVCNPTQIISAWIMNKEAPQFNQENMMQSNIRSYLRFCFKWFRGLSFRFPSRNRILSKIHIDRSYSVKMKP